MNADGVFWSLLFPVCWMLLRRRHRQVPPNSQGRGAEMTVLEIVLLAIVGFFAGYGIASAQNDAEERRRREDTGWSDFLRKVLGGGMHK